MFFTCSSIRAFIAVAQPSFSGFHSFLPRRCLSARGEVLSSERPRSASPSMFARGLPIPLSGAVSQRGE